MRTLSRSNPASVKTFWGDRFHGVLPETVTALVWRFGIYEKQTTLLILKHLPRGGVFIDIGAHFGYFTMLASRVSGAEGKVVAVEAMPATFQQLSKNVEANGLDNVRLFNRAASDVPGELVFRDFGVINSSLNTCSAPRGVLEGKDVAGTPVTVTAERADDIARQAGVDRADIVKIDAESSEEQVLSGFSGFLADRKASIILIELGGGSEEEDARALRIVASMQGYGYVPHIFEAGLLRPVTLSGRIPYANLAFAIPERLAPADLGAPTVLSQTAV